MSVPPLILVRHATPHIDPSRPSAEWDLSEEGRARAQILARRLASYAPASVYSGPEPKMTGTAHELAAALSTQVVIHQGLAEHHRRSAHFGTQGQFEESICRLFDQPGLVAYGDESADTTYARFAKVIDEALDAPLQRTLVAVSGGTAITLFVSRRAGLAPFSFWKNLKMPTAIVLGRKASTVEEILTL